MPSVVAHIVLFFLSLNNFNPYSGSWLHVDLIHYICNDYLCYANSTKCCHALSLVFLFKKIGFFGSF